VQIKEFQETNKAMIFVDLDYKPCNNMSVLRSFYGTRTGIFDMDWGLLWKVKGAACVPHPSTVCTVNAKSQIQVHENRNQGYREQACQ